MQSSDWRRCLPRPFMSLTNFVRAQLPVVHSRLARYRREVPTTSRLAILVVAAFLIGRVGATYRHLPIRALPLLFIWTPLFYHLNRAKNCRQSLQDRWVPPMASRYPRFPQASQSRWTACPLRMMPQPSHVTFRSLGYRFQRFLTFRFRSVLTVLLRAVYPRVFPRRHLGCRNHLPLFLIRFR